MSLPIPRGVSIDALRTASLACQGCELHQAQPGSLSGPTQTVFSKGNPAARVVFVGEQPGDMEDRAGLPFVGPAGQLFDRAMAEAGIDPRQAYVTNSVKHFRFLQDRPNGRRIHKTPDATHIEACKPWLRAELTILDPEVIVALGATAGRALIGPQFRVTRERGKVLMWPPSGRRRVRARTLRGGARCPWSRRRIPRRYCVRTIRRPLIRRWCRTCCW